MIETTYGPKIIIPDFRPFQEVICYFSSLFPEKRAVIAGGAIRDLWVTGDSKQIKDIDVFLLDVKEEEAPILDTHILENSHGQGALYHYIPTYLFKASYGPGVYHYPKCKVTLPGIPFPCELMYSPHATPEDLIRAFDWRACQFSYDGKSSLYPGEEDFSEGKLTLNEKIPYPKSTLRRGLMLEYKYRQLGRTLKLPKSTLLALVAMMAFN